MNQRLRRHDLALQAIAGRWRLALGGAGANAELAARVNATLLPREPLDAALAVSLS
jgi:hypothetical protein